MSQTITRMYGTPQRATAAEAGLREAGFGDGQLKVVLTPGQPAPGANTAEPSVESLAAEIAAANILKAHARIYAGGIIRGGSFVAVHAPFGTAAQATRILNSFDPIDSGVADEDNRLQPWDEAAPMSSALQMPVFLAQPTPFSVVWNVPVLVHKATVLSSWLGLPVLAKKPAPLSGAIGLPTLASRFNLSALIGLPVLVKSGR